MSHRIPVDFSVQGIGDFRRVWYVGSEGGLPRFLGSLLPHLVEISNVGHQGWKQCSKDEKQGQPIEFCRLHFDSYSSLPIQLSRVE